MACRNLATGRNLMAFYSRAEVDAVAPAGYYVATRRGFEWHQPPTPASEVRVNGRALADSLIRELGYSLPD